MISVVVQLINCVTVILFLCFIDSIMFDYPVPQNLEVEVLS